MARPNGCTVVDRDRTRGLSASIKRMRQHGGGSINVGFFTPEIAARAMYNEFGTDTIPERAFMRTTLDQKRDKYLTLIQRGIMRLELGQVEPNKALVASANQVRNDLIDTIISWEAPPNAPSTIAKKGANNPLVDTGEMQRAIQISDTSRGDQ